MNGRSEIGWDPFCDCSKAVGSADIWDNLVSDDSEFYAHVNTVPYFAVQTKKYCDKAT